MPPYDDHHWEQAKRLLDDRWRKEQKEKVNEVPEEDNDVLRDWVPPKPNLGDIPKLEDILQWVSGGPEEGDLVDWAQDCARSDWHLDQVAAIGTVARLHRPYGTVCPTTRWRKDLPGLWELQPFVAIDKWLASWTPEVLREIEHMVELEIDSLWDQADGWGIRGEEENELDVQRANAGSIIAMQAKRERIAGVFTLVNRYAWHHHPGGWKTLCQETWLRLRAFDNSQDVEDKWDHLHHNAGWTHLDEMPHPWLRTSARSGPIKIPNYGYHSGTAFVWWAIDPTAEHYRECPECGHGWEEEAP